MDTGQYSTLMDALKHIPDPRKRRGKRYAWLHLLTILVAGLASGERSARAIAQWALLHADELRQHLPDLHALPSQATILRTMRHLDAPALDRLLTTYTASLPSATDQTGCIITL